MTNSENNKETDANAMLYFQSLAERDAAKLARLAFSYRRGFLNQVDLIGDLFDEIITAGKNSKSSQEEYLDFAQKLLEVIKGAGKTFSDTATIMNEEVNRHE